jgi:hypothetical protein
MTARFESVDQAVQFVSFENTSGRCGLETENETWDRDNPALFYERLALLDGGKYRTRRNPGSTRQPQQRSAARQTAKEGGCIGVILSAGLLIVVVFAVLFKA